MSLFRSLLLLVILGGSYMLFPFSYASSAQTARSSLGISPDHQDLAPGETSTMYVTASNSEGGSIEVRLGEGIHLLDMPTCTEPCGPVVVMDESQGTSISYNVDSSTTAVRLHIVVDPSVVPGTTLSILAQMVGGEPLIRVANAYIRVVDFTPPTPLPTMEPSATHYSLGITPQKLMSAPGGTWTYFVQPTVWTTDSHHRADYSIEVTLPRNLTLVSDPVCAQWTHTIPTSSTCTAIHERDENGFTISAELLYEGGLPKGLYLPLELDPTVEIGSVLMAEFTMVVRENGNQVFAENRVAEVIAVDELELPQTTQQGLSLLLESSEDYQLDDGHCFPEQFESGEVLGLLAWGEPIAIETATLRPGNLVPDDTGHSSAGVCRIHVMFADVGNYDIFSVATLVNGTDSPCRACYLGIVVGAMGAVPVIPLRNLQ